jgi:hypothetical protein
VIDRDTELVIDGYNRSANTFTVYAFQLSQPRPVRVAHHLHAPAQILAAVHAGLPTLVLIRDPHGAVLSQAVREPHVSLKYALWAYIRFYTCLLPHRTGFVVGDFDQTTNDFGSVIRRLNQVFGTSYAEFVHTDENVRRCRDLMNRRPVFTPHLDRPSWMQLAFESGQATAGDLLQAGQAAGDQREGPDSFTPSADRGRAKAALESEWAGDRLAELRQRADDVYAKFVA